MLAQIAHATGRCRVYRSGRAVKVGTCHGRRSRVSHMRHRDRFDPRSAYRNRNLRLIHDPPLSQHEKRLLRRLARGYSDHAIAHQIGGTGD